MVLIIRESMKLICEGRCGRGALRQTNQDKHCGFVFHRLQLRLFGGDSNRSGLSELVISWVTLDVLFA